MNRDKNGQFIIKRFFLLFEERAMTNPNINKTNNFLPSKLHAKQMTMRCKCHSILILSGVCVLWSCCNAQYGNLSAKRDLISVITFPIQICV